MPIATSRYPGCPAKPSAGFTLIELIIVIVISGIVAGMMASFFVTPLRAYLDQSRRTELVDAADQALRQLTRDIRRALPNSIRVSADGSVLQMVRVVDGARYRAAPPGDAAAVMSFSDAVTSFNVMGGFNSLPATLTNHAVVIYSVGVAGADIYGDPGSNPISAAVQSVTAQPGAEMRVNLQMPFRFAYPSPRNRVFMVDSAVSYGCSDNALRAIRQANYRNTLAPPSMTANWALVADQVQSCQFSYQPGTNTRRGLVTMTITLAQAGETVTLAHQVHVSNAP